MPSSPKNCTFREFLFRYMIDSIGEKDKDIERVKARRSVYNILTTEQKFKDLMEVRLSQLQQITLKLALHLVTRTRASIGGQVNQSELNANYLDHIIGIVSPLQYPQAA